MSVINTTNSFIKILKPTINKSIFLVEWLIFIVILLFQGKINSIQTWGLAFYPIIFFYLLGSMLVYFSDTKYNQFNTRNLTYYILGLFLIDQLIKLYVVIYIPLNTSIPIIPGWFEISHTPNYYGAWIFTFLSENSISWSVPIVKISLIILTIMLIPIYQYTLSHLGDSFWIHVSFVCIFSALLSWSIDMFIRGYIVDFIKLPGLVAADLKDIFAYTCTAAIFIELLKDPKNIQWKGWKTEIHDSQKILSGVNNIVIQDLQDIFEQIKKLLQKQNR